MQTSIWKKHFFGWNEDPENVAIVPAGFELTKEETELKESYKLSNEQLQWRRNTLASMQDSNLFVQEFPLNDIESFLFSGRLRFDVNRLKTYLNNSKEPVETGYLYKEKGFLKFQQDKTGLKIYSKPQANGKYIIGADVAGGVGQDNSSAIVFDFDRNIIATLRIDIDPAQFGRELSMLGEYYNNAYICCENNNHGLTTLTVLNEQEKYNNIHYNVTVDKASNTQTKRIGFITTTDTRELILNKLNDDIKNGTISIPCKDVIKELMSFIVDKHGKSTAQSGANDDMVIACAIGNYCIQYYKYKINNFDKDSSQFQFNKRRKGY